MFCKHCGKPVHDKAVVCTSCGCRVEGPITPSSTAFVVLACTVSFLFPVLSLPFIAYFALRQESQQAIYSFGAAAVGCVFWIIYATAGAV